MVFIVCQALHFKKEKRVCAGEKRSVRLRDWEGGRERRRERVNVRDSGKERRREREIEGELGIVSDCL